VTLAIPRPPVGAAHHWRAADPLQRAALVLGAVLLAAAILAPWLAPFDPDDQSLIARLRPPLGFEGARAWHLLGTDELGRDVLSRTLHGLRLTLGLALAGATIGLVLGTSLGLLAGLGPGWVDDGVMAAVDAQIAIPFTLVALLILAVFGSSLTVMVCVLGVAGWEQYARIVRGEVRRILSMPFIEGARAVGSGPLQIARRHVLPILLSPLVVQFTLALSNIVLLESTLSFLGLGVQPPTATLGSMVGTGRD
jgi:peptide/nickel transport system permease protein